VKLGGHLRAKWEHHSHSDVIVQVSILQEAFTEVVQYFGENPKQSQPNTVFSVLQRFVDGFRVSEEDFQLMQLLTGPRSWMTSVWRPKLVIIQLNQI